MPAPLTESVRLRLALAGCVAAPSDVYAGDGARFYDDLVGPDRSEIREVLDIARRVGPAVLDLAAGSGRVTLPLVRIGKRVTALDLSADMLARLREALPAGTSCDVVVADMCDFDLGRDFDLIVLAATSITLLGPDDRRGLFATVFRHLAPRGAFVLSVAGGGALRTLRESADHEIAVGSTVYLQSQQVEHEGACRVVNWMPLPLPPAPGPVPVLTTRLHILDETAVTGELQDAGFAVPEVIPVVANGIRPGEGMVLLRTRVDQGATDVA
ncbi:daptide-type RiPP biosynthesis methyltransferase [Microbacterium sp. NPDC016588]